MGEDARFMRRALELAREAEGAVSPRPPVGAIVVDVDGNIVGEGYTQPHPGPHAEAAALAQAGDRARSSTIYVTLEPCTRSSVSTSCVDALIAAGVRSVVAATKDPHPDVNGRGFRKLRSAGVDVRTGNERKAVTELIEPFAIWAKLHRPYVTLKLAASLDGKISAPDGTSQWISGPESRAEVHEMRRRADAVMVGAGTVLADDPQLTYRSDADGTQPLRIVVDGTGRAPADSAVFDGSVPTLVVTAEDVPDNLAAIAREGRIELLRVPPGEGGVDLRIAMTELASRGICSVLCEGGPALAGSLVELRLVDRLVLYLAPKLIGGDAMSFLGAGVKTLADAWPVRIERVRKVGDDLRLDCSLETV